MPPGDAIFYVRPNTITNLTLWKNGVQVTTDFDLIGTSGEYNEYQYFGNLGYAILKAPGYNDLEISLSEGTREYYTMVPLSYISTITHGDTTYTIKDAEARGSISSLIPSQTGQSGKFLTTNGTTVSWATVDALPSQTGQSGKFLTTNGSTASWATIEEGANKDLSNLTSTGEARLHALKGYLDEGELLTDSEGLTDVTSYAHSTFDSSKFTVTGSPTITDGVVSNITKTSYIGGIPFNTANATTSWEIRFSFDLTSSPSNNPYLLWTSQGDSGMRMVCTVDDVRIVSTVQVNSSMASGQRVNVIVHYDIATTTMSLTIYKNGTLVGTNSSTRANYANSTIYLGARPNVDYPFTQGSFDLKDLAVFIDGALVFSGNKTGVDTYTINNETVLIPYTLSKTGSKIVDSAYRSQVSAVYQAYGYAPYYTLSSTDYTIPQGELYGMLGNKSKVTIRDWSVNNS